MYVVQNIHPNKRGFYEVGDMMLTEDQFKMMYFPNVLVTRSKDRNQDPFDRKIPQNHLWKNRTLPYYFNMWDYEFTKEEVEKVENAVKHFNDQMKGCLTIR